VCRLDVMTIAEPAATECAIHHIAAKADHELTFRLDQSNGAVHYSNRLDAAVAGALSWCGDGDVACPGWRQHYGAWHHLPRCKCWPMTVSSAWISFGLSRIE